MKKLLATLLALALVLALFAACGNAPSSSAPSSSDADGSGSAALSGDGSIPSFNLGFSIWGTSDSHGRYVTQAAEWCEALGGTVTVDVAQGFTVEAQMTSIENLIQSGVDMLTFCAYAGESVIPKISQLCQENEVYFALWDTTITDPDIQAMVDANPYFCGTTNEDQEAAGYEAVKILADKGAKNFVLIKYAVGVATCDEREAGAVKALEELGLNNVYTIVAPEDVKKSVQDVLTNYPEVDAIVALGGTSGYVTPSIQAIDAVGKKGKVYTAGFDFSDTMGDEMAAGDLSLVFGGHVVTSHFANLMCISAFAGAPVNPDKELLIIPYLTVTSQEDIDNYNQSIVGDTAPYTAEEMLDCITGKSFEEFQAIASAYSIDDVVARHG